MDISEYRGRFAIWAPGATLPASGDQTGELDARGGHAVAIRSNVDAAGFGSLYLHRFDEAVRLSQAVQQQHVVRPTLASSSPSSGAGERVTNNIIL